MRKLANLGLVGLFACLIVVIIYFSFVFPGSLPDHRLIVGWNDLILHMGAFGLLSLLAFAIRGLNARDFSLLVATGAFFEFVQIFLPGREVAFSDFLANLCGVLAAAGAVMAFQFVRKNGCTDQAQ